MIIYIILFTTCTSYYNHYLLFKYININNNSFLAIKPSFLNCHEFDILDPLYTNKSSTNAMIVNDPYRVQTP